jgi:hypothetical protein
MLSHASPIAPTYPTSVGHHDWTLAPANLHNGAQSLIGQRMERLVEACDPGNAALLQEYLTRFRQLICADCEQYGDPDCMCPLIALPLTTDGRRILERERRERAIGSSWFYEEAPETD